MSVKNASHLLSWVKARINSVLTLSTYIRMPSIRCCSSIAAYFAAYFNTWVFICWPRFRLVVPLLLAARVIYSLNCFCVCFMSLMIDIFCSIRESWVLRVCACNPYFQFSMSVLSFIAGISCYCIAKMFTFYFFRVSTRSSIPFSRSWDLMRATNSCCMKFLNSSFCFRVFILFPSWR